MPVVLYFCAIAIKVDGPEITSVGSLCLILQAVAAATVVVAVTVGVVDAAAVVVAVMRARRSGCPSPSWAA